MISKPHDAEATPVRTRRDAAIAAGITALGEVGFAVMPGLVGADTWNALRAEATRRDEAGELSQASIGNAATRTRTVVRGDRTAWLDNESESAAENEFREVVEALRVALNASLYLGLLRYDGHYALYPAGATYARHLDRFSDDDRRALSLVLYLNDSWQESDGGALRLYLPGGGTHDVLPMGGTVAAFLSHTFPHEVLAATRTRLALTGWLSRRR